MPRINKVYIFIVLISVVKIFFAAFLELGNDESYYYTYALQPQLNYFDHPPFVGILIRFTTLNLTWVNDVSLRLGAIISCAVASFFIYKIASTLHSTIAGWFAVLFYHFSIYTGIIAGFFIMPDSLQMPLWCASLYLMVTIIHHKKIPTKKWLLLGLLIGLATLCKVHSLYLWLGFGLFLLIYRVKWLAIWQLYAAVGITLLCCIPILLWNIQNNFITYTFHSQRVSHTSLNIDAFIQELVGEMLYQNPIIFFVLVATTIYFFSRKSESVISKENRALLFFLSIPMIVLFWCLSLFNDILPHWSGPGYIALQVMGAIYLAETQKKWKKKLPLFAGGLLGVLFVATVFFTHIYGKNFGNKSMTNYGEGCPTLDISGWKEMSKEFAYFYKSDLQNKNIKNPVIIINKWFPACQLELYTSKLCGLPIVAVGELQDVHQFAWLNKIRPQIKLGNDAYCIIPSNQFVDVKATYKKYFEKIELATTLNHIRGHNMVRYFYVYRLKNCVEEPKSILP
jgi:4-amino-4-deoxy-L-arabinose transferase-like glycosyltransferase